MVSAAPRHSRQAIAFVLASAFINFAGIGIVNPVLPFITSQYVTRQDSALVIGLLVTAYSICQFLAVPVLGALSDRYGRRPILLISLFGSALGYIVFGIGGALWVLFLGRIIDGLTGGNIATIYAYAADITEEKERTRLYGVVGALSGLGFVIGPALGAVVYNWTGDPAAPVWAAALVMSLNTLWGIIAMRESLSCDHRDAHIKLSRLNPLAQFWDVFRLPQLRSLLLGTFLWAFAYAILQGNLNFLTVDRFAWTPDQTSLLFFVGGLFAVLSQGILIKRLLPRLGEVNLTMIGIGLLTASYLLIGFATLIGNGNWMLVAIALVGLGNGLIMPALAGLLSQAVSEKEQGRVQGGNHSAQALARVVGPLWAGWVYQQIGAGAPYLSGAVSFVLAGWLVMAAVPVRNAPRSHQAAGAD